MIKNDKPHIVNFSGGRTSGVLVHEIEDLRRRGLITADVTYLFNDTGAEHPETYTFIKKVVDHYAIDLVCLKPTLPTSLKKPPGYEIVSVEDIGYDLQTWRKLLARYGAPFNPGGGFCTDKLKSTPAYKFGKDRFGLGGYYRWIGYRIDEAKRAWGHRGYSLLVQAGYDSDSAGEIMLNAREASDISTYLREELSDAELVWKNYEKSIDFLTSRVQRVVELGFHFLFEISDRDKDDVLRFWSRMPFDLNLNEHLGNCMFCIKKGDNRVELASRLEQKMAEEWQALFTEPGVRKIRPPENIYRNEMSLAQIHEKYRDFSDADLIATMRMNHDGTALGCSQSCETFAPELDDLGLDDEEDLGL